MPPSPKRTPRPRLLPYRESFFRSRPYARIVLIIAIIVLLVGGFFAYRYFSSYESTDDAQVDGHLMPLSARISGYIIKVNVDDNQYVQQGDVLAEIDPRDYQVAARKGAGRSLRTRRPPHRSLNINVPITSVNTTSQVSASQADVENAEAGISAAQQQFDAAQAQLAQAQANDVKAQKRSGALQTAGRQAGNFPADLRPGRRTGRRQQCRRECGADLRPPRPSSKFIRLAPSCCRPRPIFARRKPVRSRWLDTRARAISRSHRAAEAGGARSGQTQSAIHENHRSGRRHGDEERRSGNECSARPAAIQRRSAGGRLGHREFQGDPAEIHAPGQRAEIKVDANGRTYKGHVDSFAGSSGARLSLLPPENATGNYVKVVQRIPVKIVLRAGRGQRSHAPARACRSNPKFT